MGGHKDDSILSLGASYRSPLQDASSLVDLDNLWGRHFSDDSSLNQLNAFNLLG